jgi:hypothetical protein
MTSYRAKAGRGSAKTRAESAGGEAEVRCEKPAISDRQIYLLLFGTQIIVICIIRRLVFSK